MLLLDRYILLEWLKIFAMTLSAMIGLLLIGRVFGDMPDFMEWKASTWLTLQYFALQIPSYLPLVLPVALLISVLFILGFFHRNQELTAMRATGMSIFRVTRVLWISGAALAVALFLFNATLVPWATERGRFLYETAEFSHLARQTADGAASKKEGSLTYANNAAGRLWYIAQFSGYTGQGLGISVYQSDPATGRLREAWVAQSGAYDPASGHWVLRDGRQVVYDPATQNVTDQPPFKGEKSLPLLTEQPRVMLALTKKPTHLSINEIRGVLNDAGEEKSARMSAYAVQYHYVLASPFCCLIVIGLAIPFAVTGVRVNPMVGVSKSILLFALYYLLTNLCSLLGAQQHLSPILAAWLPNLFMFALAAWLCHRVN